MNFDLISVFNFENIVLLCISLIFDLLIFDLDWARKESLALTIFLKSQFLFKNNE